MKVKKFEIKIHNAKSGIPIVQIDASILSPRSKKKREGKKIENIELSNPSVLFCIERQKERKRE